MRHILEISSRAVAGREEDYERWYANVHVGEVLALPGFVSVERFSRSSLDGQPTGEFVALYTVETDDPAALIQSLFAATPTMQLTDAIDGTSVRFEILTPRGNGVVTA